MINFIMKNEKVKYLKGVVYGDTGSGKTVFASNFARKSCIARGKTKILLIDTEKGWAWIKDTLQDYTILEPDVIIDKNNYTEIFTTVKELVKSDEEISCVVIDSISFIGDLIKEDQLYNLNEILKKKGKKEKDDFGYVDWVLVKEKQKNIISIIRDLECDVMLCGRATSSLQQDEFKVIPATDRTVVSWKDLRFEFDFGILSENTINIKDDNSICNFSLLVIKSRIADQGKVVKDIDHWFDFINIKKLAQIKEERQQKIEKSEQLLSEYKDKIIQTCTLEDLDSVKNSLSNIKQHLINAHITELGNVFKNKNTELKQEKIALEQQNYDKEERKGIEDNDFDAVIEPQDENIKQDVNV